MHRSLALAFSVFVVTIAAVRVDAAPITFRAAGQIGNIIDAAAPPDFPSLLGALSVGMPWQLDVTFESTTPATPLVPPDTMRYANAILDAQLQIGSFVYTRSDGDIYVNWGLPVGISGFGGPGLVQFHWTSGIGGWSGGLGGPDLNAGAGLTIFSWNDLNALDGSLPTSPAASPDQGLLSGLFWSAFWGIPEVTQEFSSADVDIDLVPVSEVPEPSTLLMLGLGIAGFAAVRRTRCS
jgi:hypothetical protein